MTTGRQVTVVFSKEFREDLDRVRSPKAEVWDFVQRLKADDLTRLERPRGAVDKRVRTARVDRNCRAVMFDLSTDGQTCYLLMAIKSHDEAYTVATSMELPVYAANVISATERRTLRAPRVDGRPVRVSRRLVEQAVRILPPIHRARYGEEWRAELAEIAETAGKHQQLAFALRLLCYTVPLLRRELCGLSLDAPVRDQPW